MVLSLLFSPARPEGYPFKLAPVPAGPICAVACLKARTALARSRPTELLIWKMV
jgi:hypothetical protein